MFECRFISVMDIISFFYQWNMKKKDQYKLMMILYREQEEFQVMVMNYKNSLSYIQKQIDNLLKSFRQFARAYVDDIVVFSKTLEEHERYLHKVFELCT